MTHNILLLGSIVVVIIWNIAHHYFCFLHHIYSPWNLLLHYGLALLLTYCYLSVLVLSHHLICLLILALFLPELLRFLVIHLLTCQYLSLHLNVVHFLLLIKDEGGSCRIDLGCISTHLLEVLHIYWVTRMPWMRELFKLITRRNVSVLLSPVQNRI